MSYFKVHDINYINAILFKRKYILNNKVNKNEISIDEYNSRTKLIDDVARSLGLHTNAQCFIDIIKKQFSSIKNSIIDEENKVVKSLLQSYVSLNLACKRNTNLDINGRLEFNYFLNELQIISETMQYNLSFTSLTYIKDTH
jgi:hypothetical protein